MYIFFVSFIFFLILHEPLLLLNLGQWVDKMALWSSRSVFFLHSVCTFCTPLPK